MFLTKRSLAILFIFFTQALLANHLFCPHCEKPLDPWEAKVATATLNDYSGFFQIRPDLEEKEITLEKFGGLHIYTASFNQGIFHPTEKRILRPSRIDYMSRTIHLPMGFNTTTSYTSEPIDSAKFKLVLENCYEKTPTSQKNKLHALHVFARWEALCNTQNALPLDH